MLAALFLCSGPAAGLVAGAQQRVLAPPTTQLTVRCAVEGPGSAGEDAVLGGLPPRPPDGPLCDYPGCDNRGRVMGGLGATYLFQWWPIKVRTHHCGDCAADEGVRSLLTCTSAGVPPVPEVCGAGHQVQSKRADPRRDRLQEEPGGRAVSRGAGSGQRHSPAPLHTGLLCRAADDAIARSRAVRSSRAAESSRSASTRPGGAAFTRRRAATMATTRTNA